MTANLEKSWGEKLRHKFNGARTAKITAHLLELLFVTAVGISLHRGPGLQFCREATGREKKSTSRK